MGVSSFEPLAVAVETRGAQGHRTQGRNFSSSCDYFLQVDPLWGFFSAVAGAVSFWDLSVAVHGSELLLHIQM